MMSRALRKAMQSVRAHGGQRQQQETASAFPAAAAAAGYGCAVRPRVRRPAEQHDRGVQAHHVASLLKMFSDFVLVFCNVATI